METHESQGAPRKEPLIGPGRFQWSAGAWFGSLFGGTAWLFLGAATLAPRAQNLAMTWAACGLASIAIGLWLWSLRERLLPYPAHMRLLLTLWIGAAVAIVSMVRSTPSAMESLQMNRGLALGCLSVFPIVLIQFAILERTAKATR